MNNVFYLKTKIVVGEVSVIDNSRIQALRGNKEKILIYIRIVGASHSDIMLVLVFLASKM